MKNTNLPVAIIQYILMLSGFATMVLTIISHAR